MIELSDPMMASIARDRFFAGEQSFRVHLLVDGSTKIHEQEVQAELNDVKV